MIATLGRSENSPYFGVADLRSYDVWGAVRSGSTTGDPKQRYCANLGHVQDDESGLIYMRARYYEPWSGRFISEDPARSGGNWYTYCDNDPCSNVDFSGCVTERQLNIWLAELLTDCFVAPEARWVLQAFVVFWTLELGIMDTLFKFTNQFRKWMFVMECESIVALPGIVGSVGDRARAEARAYSIGLQVTMWILFGDLWTIGF
ncbi:MAG: RHS repeat-associated core domain-containing protein [Armatimonadetes bacterium]|nr:RHS repeat-associated core domain-containing protein [Armatimonadota bacterium]